jgi:predicted alpha/beta-fold hydrolase
MALKLEKKGIRVIRLNMRGCGTGKGLAKRIYHSGRSEDVLETLKVLKKENPDSPMVLIGFSLGGNITLKLVGELGELGAEFLKGAIAITPPADLHASIERIENPDQELYLRYFYRLLRKNVHYIHEKFKDLPRINLPSNLKISEFDQIYTAPYCGFLDAADYYKKCSSAQFVKDIRIPTRILFSQDDPIISSTSLDSHSIPSKVLVFKTKKGGHMGYVGRPNSERGFYWLDGLLLEWIEELLYSFKS